MQVRELNPGAEHERVVECVDEDAGYHGIIAIHSTRLGPAVGGTRFWPYGSADEAVADVLRLSRGMSYKAAVAGLPLGGGKSVIIGDSRNMSPDERERVLLAHGRFIQRFAGRYIAGEDVGTSPADMDIMRRETPYVAGLIGRSGDPSPHTARGVLRAMQAAAQFRWGSSLLEGKTVAIQGVGNVGSNLARELKALGAQLVLSDVDAARAERVAADVGGRVVATDAIVDAECDIFAPCALGAIIDDESIPRLRCTIVVGAANNQLREERHGRALEERGIVYVPDYVANAGGVINGSRELSGDEAATVAERVERIYDTTLAILESARESGIAAHQAADRRAEKLLGVVRAD